jgi:hypothetical protein
MKIRQLLLSYVGDWTNTYRHVIVIENISLYYVIRKLN